MKNNITIATRNQRLPLRLLYKQLYGYTTSTLAATRNRIAVAQHRHLPLQCKNKQTCMPTCARLESAVLPSSNHQQISLRVSAQVPRSRFLQQSVGLPLSQCLPQVAPPALVRLTPIAAALVTQQTAKTGKRQPNQFKHSRELRPSGDANPPWTSSCVDADLKNRASAAPPATLIHLGPQVV